MVDFVKRNFQQIFNIYLSINFVGFATWQCYAYYVKGQLGFNEILFISHNIILAVYLLIRTDFKSIEKRFPAQAVALAAFFSGAAFMGLKPTGGEIAEWAAFIVISLSNILGLMTVFNLGTSFGILITCRKVKTGGLYRLVRHPMYFTDILLRVGFVIGHFSVFSVIALVLSSALYVYRAILEEKLLSKEEEYRNYMERVQYRFLPFLF